MDVKLPKLGEGADSGVVVGVFVKEGDTVTRDQALIEIENEKAVASIPSPADGKVGRIFVKPGDKLTLGQRILSLVGGDEPAAVEPAPTSEPAGASAPTAAARAPEPIAEPEAEAVSDQSMGPAAASPTLRALAKQLGIDLGRVRGSARGGRILMADLRAYIQRLEQLAAAARSSAGAGAKAKAPAEKFDFAKWGPVTIKALSPLRQTIARRMAASWEAVPRVTQFDEADVTRLLELRQRYQSAYEQKGVRLTLTPLVLKALVGVLQNHPTFNASLDSEGEHLVLKSYYHLGIAVDTEAGLIVPVIRDADKKGLIELARELEDLARKARERKVTGDDLKGGTFTVSNQGGIGGAHFTPVVNLPEVAILGLGRGTVKPVWRSDKFEPRTLLPLALSYDHRVIDGASAARFISDLTRAIEQFDEALVRL